VQMKTCADCKETKPVDDFSRWARGRDGRHPYCKACSKIRHRELYLRRGKERQRTHKVCTWCKQDLPREAYRTTEQGKYHPRCAACEDEVAAREGEGKRLCNVCREWLEPAAFYASHLVKEHVTCRECTRAWHRGNRPNRRVFELVKTYGITAEQYDELVAKQGGVCPICLEPLPPDRAGHVDHAHGGEHQGKIRAILHRDCNRFVMWMHEDSVQLRRAADLIDNPLTDWIVTDPTPNERRREKERQK